MIDRNEILTMSKTLDLRPDIVEKDYVLGWLLAGISTHKDLSDNWVFKGGTCLKKCYFETYRFSEDLDFTLVEPKHLDQDFLKKVFSEISEDIYEKTGIELPVDLHDFEIYKNPRGNTSCRGKISYRGPISPSSGGLPRIKLDLTSDELLVLEPARVIIHHPYSDSPRDGIDVLSYAYEEVFAEKVRALAERTRPRDLYDVINLFRNTEALPLHNDVMNVLDEKCKFKGIKIPQLNDFDDLNTLNASWSNMLAHQLPALPPLQSYLDELPDFFAWLEKGETPETPHPYRISEGETILRTRRLPGPGTPQSYIQVISFAAANKLCIDLEYLGSIRRIEPYSLRRTKDGNVLLHAHNIEKDQHRSYRVDRITDARITDVIFDPKWEIELTPKGPNKIPPTFRAMSRVTRRSASSLNVGAGRGMHIYECTVCGRQFRRKTRNGKLKPHKDKYGHKCYGRSAIWVDSV